MEDVMGKNKGIIDNKYFKQVTELTRLYDSVYKLYQELCIGKFGGMIPFLSEACIAKYNNIFYKYGFDSHSTKHFSLIEYMLKHENMYGDGFSLCNEFVYMLNSFCFQFKAIYTTEKMWSYMFKANKDYIINSLIFLS